jgi:hypothetical protein
MADAKTIADSRNTTRFEVESGSTVTFEDTMSGYQFNGNNYDLDFSDETANSLLVEGATLSGTLVSSGSAGYIQCRVLDGTVLPSCGMSDCVLTGTIELNGVFYLWDDCKSADTPIINLTSGSSQSVRIYDFSGNLQVASMKAGDEVTFSGDGHLTIGSDCTGGTINLYRSTNYTDNVAGGFVAAGGVINDQSLSLETKQDIIDANVDTLLTRIPAALFAGMTSLAQWLGLIAIKKEGNAQARTELNDTGSTGGAYDETTDSQEAIRDEMVSEHAALPTAVEIADSTLIRAVENVEDTADRHSLGAMIMIGTNASVSGLTMTAKKPSDDSTFATYTVTVDASGDPITGIS